MKKIVIAIMLLITFAGAVSVAHAQEWRTANQSTISWQAVTTKTDGNPLSAGDVVDYTIFVANSVTDPDKANPEEVGTTADLTYTITLNVEGRYFVGVRANRALVDDPDTVLQSDIAWSDDPAYATVPFGLQFYLPPAAPTGLQ